MFATSTCKLNRCVPTEDLQLPISGLMAFRTELHSCGSIQMSVLATRSGTPEGVRLLSGAQEIYAGHFNLSTSFPTLLLSANVEKAFVHSLFRPSVRPANKFGSSHRQTTSAEMTLILLLTAPDHRNIFTAIYSLLPRDSHRVSLPPATPKNV